MSQYKVPQNVETEDKILGPLSVKQFIYVVIGILWAFLMWRLFSFAIIVAVIFAFPVTGFFLLLGFGKREGVAFEDYVVAFIRYLTVPRKRQWIKDDSKEVIVEDEKPTDQPELRNKNVSVGELKHLANIIDTRGNYKDPSISLPDDNNAATVYAQRIIGPAQVGGAVAASEAGVINSQTATTNDDVLDAHNPRQAQVNQMLQTAEQQVKKAAVEQMNQAITQPLAPEPAVQQVQTTPEAAKIVQQTAGLTVQRVAAHANQENNQLNAGTTVQLRTQNSNSTNG